MILAAIDIGSNAIRLQLVRVYEDNEKISFKRLEYLRFPLRLGNEVFKKGKISGATAEKFVKLMKTFKLLIDLYEIDAYNAVATSAMREAENGKQIRKEINELTGLDIKIISGKEEARILNKAIIPYLNKGHYLHIDVGGGSTELNLYEGKELIDSKSVKLGSVRSFSNGQHEDIFNNIKQWIKKSELKKSKNITGIGTGGNINKLHKISTRPDNTTLSLVELKALRAYVKEFSYKQRMSMLKMNPDRADVIIPASDIYIKVLEGVESDQIIVPRVGLKDGLIYELFARISGRDLREIEFLGD